MDDLGKIEDPSWEKNNQYRISKRSLFFLGLSICFTLFFVYNIYIEQTYISGVDWIFGLVLIFCISYILFPLYQNPRLTKYYTDRFRKNKPAVLGLLFLVFIFSTGISGWLFIEQPDVTPSQAYQPPFGFSTPSYVPIECVGDTVDGMCRGTLKHPLGTTGDGKDILALIILGMHVSMQVGITATFISVVIATLVGASAAYFGGYIDEIVMRYVDIQLTFPTFFLYLLLVYLFGHSLLLLIIIFGVTSWGGIARIVRSEALQRREEPYIDAAKGIGASHIYIIRKHIIPNVSNSIMTAATLNIPIFILSEAALAFIGLSDPTVTSWGQVISSGRGDLGSAWWISTIPGIFLFLTILAFNFIGDALRDALDPRHRI